MFPTLQILENEKNSQEGLSQETYQHGKFYPKELLKVFL